MIKLEWKWNEERKFFSFFLCWNLYWKLSTALEEGRRMPFYFMNNKFLSQPLALSFKSLCTKNVKLAGKGCEKKKNDMNFYLKSIKFSFHICSWHPHPHSTFTIYNKAAIALKRERLAKKNDLFTLNWWWQKSDEWRVLSW